MDDRELELLRQRIAFLEQTVERFLEEMAALQTRVAMLEARPVAVPGAMIWGDDQRERK